MARRLGAVLAVFVMACAFGSAAHAQEEVARGLRFEPPQGATLRVEPSIGWLHWMASELPPIPEEGVSVRLRCRFFTTDEVAFLTPDIPPLGELLACNPPGPRAPSAEMAPFVDAARHRAVMYQFDLSATPEAVRRREYRPIAEIIFRADEVRALDFDNAQFYRAADLLDEYAGEYRDADVIYSASDLPPDAPHDVALQCIVQTDYSFACTGEPRDESISAERLSAARYAVTPMRAVSTLASGETTIGAATRVWVRFREERAVK